MNLTFQKLGNDADRYAVYNEDTGETLAVTYNDHGGKKAEMLAASPKRETTLLEILAAMLPEGEERKAILAEIGAPDEGAETDGDLFRISADDRELAHWRSVIRQCLKI